MAPRRRKDQYLGTIALDSEFASARVSLDLGANAPRLRIYDVRHGTSILLDPMDLAGLANADPENLSFLHLPGAIYGRAGQPARPAGEPFREE